MLKRMKVRANERALVYRNGGLESVLKEGTYWLWKREVVIYDITKPFLITGDFDINMQNKSLAEALELIVIKDNEIAIQLKNGLYFTTLGAGRYAYWKDSNPYTYEMVNLDELRVGNNINKSWFGKAELLRYLRVFPVDTYQIGLLYVEGTFVEQLTAGTYYFWKNDQKVDVYKADMRKTPMEVNGQELLTKDKAGIRINFYVIYQIVDVVKALIDTQAVERQIYGLMQLALREYIGYYTLDELLADKNTVSDYILKYATDKASMMGVALFECGIKDIILPGDMKEIMNQVLVAEKKAQANVIMRREETASTRSLLNTAKLMEDNEMLFRLKEMEYVEKIAENIKNVTVSGGGQIFDQLKTMFGTGKAN